MFMLIMLYLIPGQFYVIGSPQEVFGTSQVQRSLAPRLGSSIDGGPRAVRVSHFYSLQIFIITNLLQATNVFSSFREMTKEGQLIMKLREGEEIKLIRGLLN